MRRKGKGPESPETGSLVPQSLLANLIPGREGLELLVNELGCNLTVLAFFDSSRYLSVPPNFNYQNSTHLDKDRREIPL